MNRALLSAAAALVLGTAGAAAAEPMVPRPEHPTPDAVRPHWANLNGDWQFRFDPRDEGLKAGWQKPGADGFDQTIVVPFPWESELSRVHKPEYHGVAWYRRTLTVPDSFPKNQHVWLRFGAVDWRADVWVNGTKVVEHEGGYTPFEADVTEALKTTGGKPAELVVRVFDPTDPDQPTGKQVGWYTTTSGIWQTVWLEARPAVYVADFAVRTDINPARVRFSVHLAGGAPGRYIVSLGDHDATIKPQADGVVTFEGQTASGLASITADVASPQLWSPESPHLYDVTIDVQAPDGTVDSVRTYFGLRTIARGRYGDAPFERVLLNGKPVYLRTALNQSFNPKGVYTAPDDAFLQNDLRLAKKMGLNGLRVHIKPDEPRRLYWADKLGLLILEDMPNTWRQDETARKGWEATMRGAVVRDRNHPSVITWVAFNETWGLVTGDSARYKADRDTQRWVSRMVDEIRRLDPSRLVEDNSPCNYDHVANTDLNSWHFYIDDHARAAEHVADVVQRTEPGSGFNYCPGQTQGTAPLINSEYGGVSAGGGDRDVSWCFRDLTTILRRQPKIQGYVYTELTDIEWEHNGFANYDRSPKTFGYDAFVPGMTPADLNGADFVGYDGPPCLVVKPGAKVTVPLFVSHYSDRRDAPDLWWAVSGLDDEGKASWKGPESKDGGKFQDGRVWNIEPRLPWTPFGVAPLRPLSFTAPARPFVGALGLVLVEKDRRLAANFVNLVVKPESPLPRAERAADRRAVLRFAPDDFARRHWSGPSANPEGKAYGRGAGFFEYRVKLPAAVVKAKPEALTLRFELASKAGKEKVDWPSHLNGQDYPQTDEKAWPSTVVISLNGKAVKRADLPDDPADARGVLSHLNRVEHGSYGFLIGATVGVSDDLRAALEKGEALRIRLAVPDDAAHAGGLCVFGADTGRYPADPTVVVETADDLPSDLGVKPGDPVAVERLAARRTVVLAGGEANAPASWSYTTREPGAGWTEPDFDDARWPRGSAGFGNEGTPSLRVRTPWHTDRIWLRTAVEVPKLGVDDALILRLFHDEDAEVFVNGKPLLGTRGYLNAYRDVALDADQKALFHSGKNTVAVSCRQTGGGQGIDVGLTLLRGE